MVDSGEASTTLQSARDTRRKRRRDTSDDFRASLSKVRKICQGQQEAQCVTSKTALLNRISTILQMCRDLLVDKTDERDLLNEELLKIKKALCDTQD